MKDGGGDTIPATAGDRWSGLIKGNYYFGENDDQRLTLEPSRTDSDLDDAAVAQTGGAVATYFGTSDLHAIDDTVTLTYAHEGADNPWLDFEASLSYSDTSTERDNFSLGFMCGAGTMQVLCPNTASYETTALRLENTVEMSKGAWQKCDRPSARNCRIRIASRDPASGRLRSTRGAPKTSWASMRRAS